MIHTNVKIVPNFLGSLFSGWVVIDLQSATGLAIGQVCETLLHQMRLFFSTSHHYLNPFAISWIVPFLQGVVFFRLSTMWVYTYQYPHNPILFQKHCQNKHGDFSQRTCNRIDTSSLWKTVLIFQKIVFACDFVNKKRGDSAIMEYNELEVPLKQKGDKEIGVNSVA